MQVFTTRMKIVIVIVAAYIFAVDVLQAHAEAGEDFGDMSVVWLSRRAKRVYLPGRDISFQTF